MVQEKILKKILRIVVYAKDLAPIPTTKVPLEFTQPKIQNDIETVEGWIKNQFKSRDNLQETIEKNKGFIP